MSGEADGAPSGAKGGASGEEKNDFQKAWESVKDAFSEAGDGIQKGADVVAVKFSELANSTKGKGAWPHTPYTLHGSPAQPL